MNAYEALKQVTPATIEDIKPGAVLWHVYGSTRSKPQEFRLVTGPLTTPVMHAHDNYWATVLEKRSKDYYEDDFEPRWFLCDEVSPYTDTGFYRGIYSLRDCGIGANYNQNRLFTTRKEAQKYADLLN